MVLQIEGSKFIDVEPCKDDTIGSLIEYLQQFPENWRITLRGKEKGWGSTFELVDEHVSTVLQEIGEGPGP